MFWHRAARIGALVGTAYFVGRLTQKLDSEHEDTNARDAEFKDSSFRDNEEFHSDADEFIEAGKEALTKAAESAQGFADAIINEFERQTKNK